jgi:3'-phosphoadenosine 5'-phosphosulfate sulfotransferase (PAPS reductase)/FAD synthetase
MFQLSAFRFQLFLLPPALQTQATTPYSPPMATTAYQEAKQSLRQLYLDDLRPWLVGFSGGKDGTMVASLIFDAVPSVPPDQRKKPAEVRRFIQKI